MTTDKDIKKYIKQIQDESDKRVNKILKKHMERYFGALSKNFTGKVSGLSKKVNRSEPEKFKRVSFVERKLTNK